MRNGLGKPELPEAVVVAQFASRNSHRAIRIAQFASRNSHRAIRIAQFASRSR
jgi:hypothetical protein